MKHFLLSLFILLVPSYALAQNQEPPMPLDTCKVQVPFGVPEPQRPNTQYVCRKGYLALHDNQAKIPVWVSYVLTAERTLGCFPRQDAFAPDYSIPRGQRAELADYARSGFDIGHVANNADMSWNPIVQRESFILSNMYPQLPGLNRGIWKLLETNTRSWAWSRNTQLTILTGAVYGADSRVIGPNRVVVPNAFWKIVVDNRTSENLAFFFPHQEGLGNDLRKFQVNVAYIEQTSGMTLPVPGNKQVVNTIWPSAASQMAAAKKTACKM